MTLRLMGVHAHPDDESSKGAATLAYYRSRGVDVMVVTCTGGERGDVLNDQLEPRAMAERDLSGLRRQEMAQAQEIMGIQHRWLGFYDSGMPEGDVPVNSFADIPLDISVPPLVKVVRDFRPHVMITYDENGGYPHPDHIRTHHVAVEAYHTAGDPNWHPELGASWQPLKLYYDRILNIQRLDAVTHHMRQRDGHPELLTSMDAMRTWMAERPTTITTHVPAGDHFDTRDAALRAHASQIAPDSPFFFWPNTIQREAWPYEDFQLIDTRIATTLPETDLFNGINDGINDGIEEPQ